MLLNFSWLIPQQLAGLGEPGGFHYDLQSGGLTEDLHELRQHGIGAVVSLTERPLDDDALRSAGMSHLHLPVPDMVAPTEVDIDRFLDFVKSSQASMLPVAVHCRAGLGRTGTMLACYLVSRGYRAEEAMLEVRRLRPGSIETGAQEVAVRGFSERQKANTSEPA